MTRRVLDEFGDPIPANHVELAPTTRDPDDTRSLEQITRDWAAEVNDERFAAAHRNCEAPWVCYSCGRKVCPRCDPSPGEFIKCAECDWFTGGAA